MQVNEIVVEVALKYSAKQADLLYEMLEEYRHNTEKYGIAEEDLVKASAFIDLLVDIETEVIAVTEKHDG